ncbi:DUF4850 domain-containing protein [Brevibacillus ruminantium]|uniref:DUF4850 domain-containing protein n=1 Tax=Brevibacillus ruminantium TaxID=2950604 RepID=A0ABY4WCY4_9BACL|nr:DUF4850 domain-containing protein [Brevibacillus ruminantium]USG64711.1 DUF4850 domain-containing protein [Brevibacillus ruminantium]
MKNGVPKPIARIDSKTKAILIVAWLALIVTGCSPVLQTKAMGNQIQDESRIVTANTSKGTQTAVSGISEITKSSTGPNRTTESTQSTNTSAGDGEKSSPSAIQKVPRMISSGEVSLQGKAEEKIVTIPLKVIVAEFYLDYMELPAESPVKPYPVLPLSIPAESLNEMAAYWMDLMHDQSVFFIGPRDWELESAGVGANGSISISLKNPQNPGEKLEYRDNAGGCQGCAIGDVGTYFPEREKWADELGFAPFKKMDFSKRVMVAPTTVRYDLAPSAEGMIKSGVAHYLDDQGSIRFLKMEVTHPSGDTKAFEALLHLFAQTAGKEWNTYVEHQKQAEGEALKK